MIFGDKVAMHAGAETHSQVKMARRESSPDSATQEVQPSPSVHEEPRSGSGGIDWESTSAKVEENEVPQLEEQDTTHDKVRSKILQNISSLKEVQGEDVGEDEALYRRTDSVSVSCTPKMIMETRNYAIPVETTGLIDVDEEMDTHEEHSGNSGQTQYVEGRELGDVRSVNLGYFSNNPFHETTPTSIEEDYSQDSATEMDPSSFSSTSIRHDMSLQEGGTPDGSHGVFGGLKQYAWKALMEARGMANEWVSQEALKFERRLSDGFESVKGQSLDFARQQGVEMEKHIAQGVQHLRTAAYSQMALDDSIDDFATAVSTKAREFVDDVGRGVVKTMTSATTDASERDLLLSIASDAGIPVADAVEKQEPSPELSTTRRMSRYILSASRELRKASLDIGIWNASASTQEADPLVEEELYFADLY